MPRDIRVYLLEAVCNSQGAGDPIQISGSIFGATYHNNPNDPNDQEAWTLIYSFPDGPITLPQGQTVPIHMPQGIPFLLSSDTPVIRYLKIVGQLDNGLIGDPMVLDDLNLQLGLCLTDGPTLFPWTFSGNNLTVTLTFGLCVQDSF